MFDFPAFYLSMANRLPPGAVIAEVGVAEGASAIFLAEALLNLGKRFTLYLVDNLSYGNDFQLRTLLKNICGASIGNWVEVVPVPSVEAACRFPDNHFDFVFIDASHKFEWTKADITLWYQKIKFGAILAGHDYNDKEGTEVKMAVDLIIPKEATYDGVTFKTFEVVNTDQGYNIWKVKKQPHLTLRTF